MPTFDLIDQPWIPCLMRAGGALRTLGLRDVLREAPSIREIADPSPLVTAALHRLLLAILHRNFGPDSSAAWAVMWEAGRWDDAALDRYFEQWRSRFDLFDESYPFYQTPGLSFEDYGIPVAKLLHECASGNNATLFDHTSEHRPAVLTAAAAARAVVAHQAFALGGLVTPDRGADPRLNKSADGTPLVKGAVLLLRGESLFETLLLNCHGYAPEHGIPFAATPADCPAWERAEATQPRERSLDGYLDLLTWQSRRLRLRAEVGTAGIVVRTAIVMKGFQFPDGFTLARKETMIAYRRLQKGPVPWAPIGLSEERALWRDSVSLFLSVHEKNVRPGTFDWVASLMAEGWLSPRLVPMDALGLVSNQARIEMWRHERLPVPLRLLTPDGRPWLDALDRALSLAEDAGRLLNRTVRRMAEETLSAGRRTTGEDVSRLVEALAITRSFWPRLEVPYRTLAVTLDRTVIVPGSDASLVPPVRVWAGAVRQAAQAAFQDAVSKLEGTPRAWKAVARADNEFRAALADLLKPYREEEAAHVITR